MVDAPNIKVAGQGSRRDAAALGQQIIGGVSAAVADISHNLHIDTLRLQLPAGASQVEINRAIRRAITRHVDGAKR